MVTTVPYAVEKAVEKSASTTDETASTSPSRLDERAAEALQLYNPLQPSTAIQLYILYTLQPSTTPLRVEAARLRRGSPALLRMDGGREGEVAPLFSHVRSGFDPRLSLGLRM